MTVLVNHHVSGIGDGIGDGKDMTEFPYKQYPDKTDKLLIMDANGVIRYTDNFGITNMEKANWGHSGAAVAGFSTSLPYNVIAGTTYNLTTDKGGLLVENPDSDPNFRWDVAKQRFYTDVSVLGGATYDARIVIGFQLDTPKKGEVIDIDTWVYTSSATGTPADAKFLVGTRTIAIPDTGINSLEAITKFFSDSDTFTHGVGFTFTPTTAGTVSKHSIYINRT